MLLSFKVSGQDFKKEIDMVYNFHPQELSEKEQNEKIPALDKIFNEIKSDTTKYLPLLRQELKFNDHFPYFYFDSAHMLMELSKSKDDLQICADAISKCNINDISKRNYVSIVSYLSNNSVNTTNASLNILNDANFSFVVPEHAINFTQDYCLIYCLLPLAPGLYIDKLNATFHSTKDIQVQKSIITMLWFAYSCKGDEFLLSLNKNNTLSTDVKDLAKRFLSSEQREKQFQEKLNKMTERELENLKKDALLHFSDEAIDDLLFVSKAFREKYKCK